MQNPEMIVSTFDEEIVCDNRVRETFSKKIGKDQQLSQLLFKQIVS